MLDESCVLFRRTNDFKPKKFWFVVYRSKSTLSPGFPPLTPVPRERIAAPAV
jgi:hypothetical protein